MSEEKITEGKRVTKEVRNWISDNTAGTSYPKRHFLPLDQYKAMRDYLEPIAKRTVLGGHIVDSNAFNEGYENFMFQGVAICLRK